MSVTSEPVLRDRARQKANRVRSRGRAFAQEIRSLPAAEARLATAMILRNDPARISSLRVFQVFDAIPAMGEAKVRRLLTRADVWPLLRVRDMSVRERSAAAAELERLAGMR